MHISNVDDEPCPSNSLPGTGKYTLLWLWDPQDQETTLKTSKCYGAHCLVFAVLLTFEADMTWKLATSTLSCLEPVPEKQGLPLQVHNAEPTAAQATQSELETDEGVLYESVDIFNKINI